MIIKKVGARIVKDSRGQRTIQVYVKTSKGIFKTSSPSGKSTGKFEVRPYGGNLKGDVWYINNLKTIGKLDIKKFEDLEQVEKLVGNKLGGNSLFALQASILKALARENGKELWRLLGGRKKLIRSVGNSIGGGLHSSGVGGKKPEFQEFLFIANGKSFSENVKLNKIAYNLARKILKARKRNDEGAWETDKSNEAVLDVMMHVREIMKRKNQKIDIGLDVASSSFYENGYNYKNPKKKFSPGEQVNYINELIKKYNLLYVEDGLDENDFSGFAKLLKKSGKQCLIVGDDLTTTNPSRLKQAIKNKSINAIIVKPNQIGSLLKVKEVIDISNKHRIKTIISHRSGETMDDTMGDLAVGWNVDFIKTGIYGKVREVKLKRLMRIEKKE